jgi:hypothetical protein
VYTYRIHGSVYHKIGSLQAAPNQTPKFAQIYFHDPKLSVEDASQAELPTRMALFPDLRTSLLDELQQLMRTHNPYVSIFEQTLERLAWADATNTQMKMFIKTNTADQTKRYAAPRDADELAVIMPGDGLDAEPGEEIYRDIQLRKHDGGLRYIYETHSAYDPLHYVLFFMEGAQGWHPDVMQVNNTRRVTPMQYYAYRLMNRDRDVSILQKGGRLLQQYVVDQYAKIEQERLNYARTHQKELRAELYKGVVDATHAGDSASDIGQRIVLPATFNGSPREMHALYQDAMGIVQATAKPDVFVTVTCNADWPEITSGLNPGEKWWDRRDLVDRVFQLKLKAIVKDLYSHHVLGKVRARIHVIEFQKRGLPHAHILIIFEGADKLRSSEFYDSIVSAELPDSSNPLARETVEKFMMHGPCGVMNPKNVCMVDGKCKAHYPHAFRDVTIEDPETGYPLYRRRDNGDCVDKGGNQLDNRYVVPHNVWLCVK